MKPKQKENISKYIAYFLRTIGGAMIFIAFSAIVFSKNESTGSNHYIIGAL
ncbi:MAG: hypothetical protein HRT37_01330 [Alteromonadaceae bacterium]|nr:hypothetical protein [Alteromonadaceae bacterium]